MSMDYMPRTKWVLKLFGFWALAGDRTYEIKQWLNISLVLYFLVGLVLYPVSIIRDPRIAIAEKIESLAVVVTLVSFAYNYICIYYLRYELLRIFDAIENFDAFGAPPDAEERSKFVDIVSLMSIVYSVIGIISQLLISVFQMKSCERQTEESNSGIMCGFAVGLKYPYDINGPFSYCIHFVIEVYSSLNLGAKGVVYFGLAIGLFEAIVVRLNDLVSKLYQVYDDDNFEAQESRLKRCVAYHIYIIDLSDRVNECLVLVTAPCVVCYNFIIGISIMAITTDGGMKSALIVLGWIIGLLAACAIGERVMSASVAVAEAAYDIQWYTDTRLRRDISLILLRSQTPIRVKCGSLGDLSYVTFKKIMQGAYTYATMRTGLDK